MPATLGIPAPAPVIVEPTYGYAQTDGSPAHPTTRQVVQEWLDAMNGWRHPARRLPAAFFVFHVATGVFFVEAMLHFRMDRFAFGVFVGWWISFLYHTLWYHRYCSHASFSFSSPWFARVLLWTNPVAFREEMYAIPHRIHHERSDKPGDPYGPHLGWLGSFLATESQQKVNTAIDERQYAALSRSLEHIGFPANTYEAFRRTGSVERVGHYVARVFFAQLLWISGVYLIGGWSYVGAFYGALFAFTFFMREFPWRGHGGNFRATKIDGWEFDDRSRSQNNSFFGYVAGEWHDNHHLLPASANCAFLPGQIDLPFLLVRLWHRLGIVSAYYDAAETFTKREYQASHVARDEQRTPDLPSMPSAPLN